MLKVKRNETFPILICWYIRPVLENVLFKMVDVSFVNLKLIIVQFG